MKPTHRQASPLYAEQIKLLYQNAPLAYLVTVINGAILAYVQRPYISSTILIAWLACLGLTTIGRAILADYYVRTRPPPAAAYRWGYLYMIGAGTAGSVWGSTAIFLFPEDAMSHQVFVAFVLAGMTAGGVGVLSASMPASLAFVLPALLPLTGQFFLQGFLQGRELQKAMGVMTLLFLIGMLLVMRNLNRSILNTLRLRLDKTELLSQLEADKELTEQLNAKLLAEIAEHQKAEETLRESEERYRSTMDAALVGIYVIQDLTFHYVNPVMAQLLGYAPQEMEGKLSPLDVTGPEQRDLIRTRLQERAEGVAGAPIEIRCVRKDGSVFDAMVWTKSTRYRGCTVIVGTLVDITERKRIETALQQANATLERRVKERTAQLEEANASLLKEMANRKAYEAQLEQQARYDSLTQLPNRSLLRDRLMHAIAQARRNQQSIAVLFIDLDRFKMINDSLGHAAGDMLLRIVAQRLKECVRESDTVARLGGDEFVVVLEAVPQQHGAILVGQKILQALKASFKLADDQEFFITCTIGISLFPMNGEDPETLLKNANTAMHRAKERNRNSVQFYASEMNAQLSERLDLENGLRRALQAGELVLHFQPQVSLEDNRLAGVEALLRWRHPKLGIVSAGDFIPLAEETGLIVPIGAWVLRTACTQAKAWQDAGLPVRQVAVNLSPRQFMEAGLKDLVTRILQETRLAADCLELEITESLLMKDVEGAVTTLDALQALGVRLAIDDFGTGYSSLNYLKRFPIDRLKIDRSFLQDIPTDADNAAITVAIIALAHSLNLKVVAEGVENEAQVLFLRSKRCDDMQGYYYSPPLPPEELTAFLQSQHTLPLHRLERDIRQILLLVDDDPLTTTILSRLLNQEGYQVLVANSAREGLKILSCSRVGAIISDQVMPDLNGIDLLKVVKQLYPDVIRILMSDYENVSCDDSQLVYKFISKPANRDELRTTLREAFLLYGAQNRCQ